MTRTERAADASFSLAVWSRERNCVACGEPGSNAHHVLFRSQGGESVVANGVMLCGSGTTGCHGRFHESDWGVRAAVGEHIVRRRPDTLAYLQIKLGDGWLDYLRRVYMTEVEMDAPQSGKVDAAQVILYEDANGEYRWRAQDTNGKTVADSGEGYESREYTEKAATDLFPLATIIKEWEE